MAKKGNALGRGLDALLGGENIQSMSNNSPLRCDSSATQEESRQNLAAIREIPLAQITVNPYQPRTEFNEEALAELADSIAKIGIIQPITLRSIEGELYQIISGERRFRAAKRAGLTTIPAYVREADDQGMIEMALVENIQRSDLNPVEIALSFQRLLEECHLTQEELAPRVGKNRATISNYLRVLKLPVEVQYKLRTRVISMGHAKVLLALENEVEQLDLARRIEADGLSVRNCEEIVRALLNPSAQNTEESVDKEKETTPNTSPANLDYVAEMQQALEKRLGWGVKVNGNEKGSGRIVIAFRTEGERKELMQKLLQEN